MKCPLKFRLLQFEGGEECDPECAWRRGGSCAVNAEPLYVVKLAGVRRAEELENVRKQDEGFFGENGYVVVDDTVDVYAAKGLTVRFGDGE